MKYTSFLSAAVLCAGVVPSLFLGSALGHPSNAKSSQSHNSKTDSIRIKKSVVSTPRPFAIYYGWPSDVNKSNGNVKKAILAFNGYGVLVFGADNVMPGGDANFPAILSGVKSEGDTPYGYVSIGVTDGEPNYSISSIKANLNKWKKIKAEGIFLDCAGYDYGVSRVRFDEVVSYAHSIGLKVIANAWNPDDVLSKSKTMGKGDTYLGENDVLSDGKVQNAKDYTSKLNKMSKYKKELGITLYETGTVKSFSKVSEVRNKVSKIISPYGIDSLEITDSQYSANNNKLVFPKN